VTAVTTIGGQYIVEGLLGEGGMGAVYKVRHATSGQLLAAKRLVLTGQRSAASERLLFEREYFWLSQLAHPRIVEVHDFGVDEDGAYYTMELLDGEDLRVAGKRLPWPRVCSILRDVASALAVLHSRRLLHRDITPRNVRCMSDGHVKLFDFGAMVPMGVCKQVVGTPVCVPPEAMELQALDGRSDLFAVGVLAYWMLTGRYPYLARTLHELAPRWREPIVPVSTLNSDIPPALSDLVTQLLALDRDTRVSSAAEVIERLSAIADLPPEPHEGVASAYLTMPALVGRGALVQKVRDHLMVLASRADSSSADPSMRATRPDLHAQAKGAVLTISGGAGSGRTRILDACALEAKLLGFTVLRAGSGAGATGDYGVMRDLAAQLFVALPSVATSAALPHDDVLRPCLTGERQPSALPAERRRTQGALRNWICEIARQHPLVFIVDDVDRIDEPSAVLLATLAYEREPFSIALVVANESRGEQTLAVDLIEKAGHRLELVPLSADETESLVRSVFGDAEHVTAVSRRVYEVSRGSPRVAMELMEHLVATGKARYGSGSWVLPAVLTDSVVPGALMDAFMARIKGLRADALELAEALSLTDPAWMPVECYVHLTDHESTRRTLEATMALTAAGILVTEGDRYRFTYRGCAEWLARTLAAERLRQLHVRISKVAKQHGNATLILQHLMDAGCEQEAIDYLLNELGIDVIERTAPALDLVERAASAATRLGLPRVTQLTLQLRASGIAAFLGDYEAFRRTAHGALERLLVDSGLRDFEALDEAGMDDEARLSAALTSAQQRFDTTPEADRAFSVVDSIRRLARMYASFSAMAAAASDLELATLPALTPFSALSPIISVMQRTTEIAWLAEQGRFDAALGVLREFIGRLAMPDGAGLQDTYDQIRYGSLAQMAAAEALLGLPSALGWAEQLDDVPRFRVYGWLARASYHRIRGQLARSKECEKRAAVLQLEDGVVPFGSAHLRTEFVARWLSDDLLGLKALAAQLEDVSSKVPRMAVLAHLAHCHYNRLLGDHERALVHLDAARAIAKPLAHRDWCYVAAAEVELLTLVKSPEEALDHADECLSICKTAGMTIASQPLRHAAAGARLAAGWPDEAARLLEHLIREQEEMGTGGVLLLRCYDLRTRIALATGDSSAATQWLKACARVCSETDSPAIRFQQERLREDAEASRLASTESA
jgi:hypothetical protein